MNSEPSALMLRLMVMRHLLAALATVAVLAGCTGSGSDPKPKPNNLALCQAALPAQKVVNGEADSVEHFRQFTYGPGVFPDGGPLATAFPEAAPKDEGLWCWTEQEHLRKYTAWAVFDGKAERAAVVGGRYERPPSGPPMLP